MNLVELWVARAETSPDAPALIEPRSRKATTFAALEQGACRAAACLRSRGLEPGAIILVFLPMSAELYELVLGVLRLGMTALFLDPSSRPAEIDACCSLIQPHAFIAKPKAHALRLTCPSVRRIPVKFSAGSPMPGAHRWSPRTALPFREVLPCPDETPALITFTTGSTGQPKGVVRSHGFLRAQHQVLEKALLLEPGEVDLTTLPIFLLANLASGLTSVLPDADLRTPGKIRPEPVLRQIREHYVTRCAASPAFFERLLAGNGSLGALRKIFTGGAPVFPRVLEALSEAAPEARVRAIYGSTEAEPIAHLDAREISQDDHSAMSRGAGLLAGRPVDEIALRVIPNQWGRSMKSMSEAEFDELKLAPGQAGEIVVNGPHVLEGYWRGLGDNETKARVGARTWHRTGDAGRLDERGRLWLLGRCTGRVAGGRGEPWPLAVEAAAMRHPEVRRAALFAHQGRKVLALELGVGFQQTGEWRKRLAADLAWAELDELRVVPRIPMDRRHNGKVDYRALAARLPELAKDRRRARRMGEVERRLNAAREAASDGDGKRRS